MPSLRPRTGTPRPPLPLDNANPHLDAVDSSRPPPVKFQEITRDGQATVVGRVKIATPGGHAFILRRLDTGAVSLTTMFRASFPAATDDAERAETSWVKANFDISGTNKSGKSRFAGTWVSPETAKYLATSYRLGPVIDALAEANPDPNVVYRKSTRNPQTTPSASPASTPSIPPSAQTATTPTQPPATKRRRESSPSGIAVRTTSASVIRDLPTWTPLTPDSSTTTSAATTTTTGASTTAKTTRAPVASPTATRRSARLKSPAPTPAPPKTPRAARAATRERGRDKERETPPSSDGALADHEHDEDAREAAKVTEVSMSEDLREQKELIERLKAERAQNEHQRADDMDEDETGNAQKRVREEENEVYLLNIREPETEERVIATNRRVAGLRPETKSLAWGAMAFAIGWGAVTYAPYFSNFF